MIVSISVFIGFIATSCLHIAFWKFLTWKTIFWSHLLFFKISSTVNSVIFISQKICFDSQYFMISTQSRKNKTMTQVQNSGQPTRLTMFPLILSVMLIIQVWIIHQRDSKHHWGCAVQYLKMRQPYTSVLSKYQKQSFLLRKETEFGHPLSALVIIINDDCSRWLTHVSSLIISNTWFWLKPLLPFL